MFAASVSYKALADMNMRAANSSQSLPDQAGPLSAPAGVMLTISCGSCNTLVLMSSVFDQAFYERYCVSSSQTMVSVLGPKFVKYQKQTENFDRRRIEVEFGRPL